MRFDWSCADDKLIKFSNSYFVKDGSISESGTHDQLIAKRGDYYAYVQLQALNA